MATIAELRERSATLLTRLTAAPAAEPGRRGPAPERERVFRWFDPADAEAAVVLATQLALVSATAPTVEDGIERALDTAEAQAVDLPAELVEQALAIFVTHHRPARRLALPRTLRVRPELFAPSRPAGAAADPAAGPEAVLDYWREDPFANEHHQHWHRVYPFAGLPLVQEPLGWAETADRAGLAALFAAAAQAGGAPATDWPAFLASATPQEVLDRLGPLLPTGQAFGRFAGSLDPSAYRVLFRLNDRQGELFLYMHSQMLARYDAERLSNSALRVEPFDRAGWATTIADGYDPGGLMGGRFTDRPPDAELPRADVDRLTALQDALDAAVAANGLRRPAGAPAALTSDSLGAATEAAAAQLSGLRRADYPGIHNTGHNMIAAIPDTDGNPGNGVMVSPVVAIRDPVFWRWHKHIDLGNSRWQDTQPPHDFADAPPVVVRDSPTGAADGWSSPDILLVSTAGLPPGSDPAAAVATALAGDRFDTAVGAGPLAGADGIRVLDQLTTRFATSKLSDGQPITHLVHDPFALVVRLRNVAPRPVPVTLRVFLVPTAEADDRTMWMELDKVMVEVPANGRHVVFRPDTEFSVVKKPAETDPQSVIDGEADPDDPDYCDCGWPYTLLLPRGTPTGMAFRLAVFCTDANRDLVRPSGGCGSMSFCGAVDRYPDTREMGYPFNRPFDHGSIDATVLSLPSAAGRSLTIRHVEDRGFR